MQERDFLNLTEPKQRAFRRQKAPVAMGAIALVMVLAAFNVLPIAALALLAAIVVIATNCLDLEEAYEAIEWQILFIIFGMLALGKAMESSGAAHLIANGVTGAVGHLGPTATLSLLYLVATVLTELISNNAVALLLTPIAFEIAATMGVDARPFAVAVMFGCSASFATPIGYQTNTYVFGAGGYRFRRFPESRGAAQFHSLDRSECAHSDLLAFRAEAVVLGGIAPAPEQGVKHQLFFAARFRVVFSHVSFAMHADLLHDAAGSGIADEMPRMDALEIEIGKAVAEEKPQSGGAITATPKRASDPIANLAFFACGIDLDSDATDQVEIRPGRDGKNCPDSLRAARFSFCDPFLRGAVGIRMRNGERHLGDRGVAGEELDGAGVVRRDSAEHNKVVG